jgi:hypothetical protein
MFVKSFILAAVSAAAILVSNFHAEGRSLTESSKEVDVSAFSNGSIVIINEEETTTRDYVHTQYAFIDQKCGAVIVDHYGSPVDPNDSELKQSEQRMCTESAMNASDG